MGKIVVSYGWTKINPLIYKGFLATDSYFDTIATRFQSCILQPVASPGGGCRGLHHPGRGLQNIPLPQHLLHRLPLCHLINEFIELPHLFRHRIVDLFHFYTTDRACDQVSARIPCRRSG